MSKRGYVLVVDPSDDARARLCLLIDAEGHICEGAADAAEALELCQGVRFDCMVLELQLGNSSGLRFAESLRDVPEWRPRCVIGVTALPASDFVAATASGTIDAILQKPADPYAIVELIHQAAAKVVVL